MPASPAMSGRIWQFSWRPMKNFAALTETACPRARPLVATILISMNTSRESVGYMTSRRSTAIRRHIDVDVARLRGDFDALCDTRAARQAGDPHTRDNRQSNPDPDNTLPGFRVANEKIQRSEDFRRSMHPIVNDSGVPPRRDRDLVNRMPGRRPAQSRRGTGSVSAMPERWSIAPPQKPRPVAGFGERPSPRPGRPATCRPVESRYTNTHKALVAQRIESRTSNPKVVGSNPTGRIFLPKSNPHREIEDDALSRDHQDPMITRLADRSSPGLRRSLQTNSDLAET